MAYISGPASWMMCRRSVVGMKAHAIRAAGAADESDWSTGATAIGAGGGGFARGLHRLRNAHEAQRMLAMPAACTGSRKDGF